MAQRDVDITIHPDGRVEVHLQGYKGKRCLDVVQWLAQAVGSVESEQHTSEYYEPEDDVQYRQELRQ